MELPATKFSLMQLICYRLWDWGPWR